MIKIKKLDKFKKEQTSKTLQKTLEMIQYQRIIQINL